MGFENFNLDQVANAVHNRSTGRPTSNLVYNTETGKFVTHQDGQPVPRAGLVTNQMSDEGFA